MYAQSSDGGNELPSFALDSLLREELILLVEDSIYKISPNKNTLDLNKMDWDVYIIRDGIFRFSDNVMFVEIKNLVYSSSEIFRKVW